METYLQYLSQFGRRPQITQKLSMAGASVRAQKAFALDYCAASFVTEGEIQHKCAK